MIVQRLPDATRRYILVAVSIDVARGRHLPPLDVGVPCLQPISKPTGSFEDDLKAPHDRIKSLFILLQGRGRMSLRELLGQLDVPKDLAESPLPFQKAYTVSRDAGARG